MTRRHPRRIERTFAASRAGVEQRGSEMSAFYGDGTCQCGCLRSSHDYPLGPCMECKRCDEFRLAKDRKGIEAA